MGKLALAALLVVAPSAANAESVGVGLFIGEPTGFDLKVGLGRRSALDVLIGATSFRDGRTDYLHVTYLVTPFVARGRTVFVPIRLGLGAAALGVVDSNAHLAVRAPLEIAVRFRRTPLELYGELAVKLVFVEEDFVDTDVDGGVGLRIYF